MNAGRISPAVIDFNADGAPRSPLYDDRYHPRIGAAAQARHVFLAGNGLPDRWAGRDDFTILETGFGLGNNFLATWDQWRRDPLRQPGRLHVVSIERHPPSLADLRRAHAHGEWPDLAAQLQACWPPLTAGLHRLDFDAGRVQLLLALGDVQDLLYDLVLRVDAFYLDGFAPARNPRMWEGRVVKSLARLAAPGATVATWSVARELREGLRSAGFEVSLAAGIGGKREITLARWAPRFTPRGPVDLQAPRSGDVVVIGAGLAGAATAAALASRGRGVIVLDRQDGPAAETSGNPAGLFHGTLHRDDGIHARLFRASALAAATAVKQAIDASAVPGQVDGLLRLEHDLDVAAMRDVIERLGLPGDYVQACDAGEASTLAGVSLASPAWHYPRGGWVSPAGLVGHWLQHPGIRFRGRSPVARITRDGALWQVFDADGDCLASAEVLVLANAADASRLLADLWPTAWPLRLTRGQVSAWRGSSQTAPAMLRRPVVGEGYALPWGAGGLLCGATQSDDRDLAVSMADHLVNFERLRRTTGLQPPADRQSWLGRVGWRLLADDRLPIVGAVPSSPLPADTRIDQVRRVPRQPGLYVATAFGGRGLTLAPLAGQLLAAQICGTPWPLERSLAEAMDPARWWVRSNRKAAPR